MTEPTWSRRGFLAAGAAGLGGSTLAGCAVFDATGWKSIVGYALGRGAAPLPPLKSISGEGVDEEWFRGFISDFVKNHPANAMVEEFKGEPIFKDSLVGFVSGDDKLLYEYKSIIGPFHHTPEETMAWAAVEQGVKAPAPSDTGVVSFVLPLADPIVADNADEDRWCSKRWAQARLYGEILCRKLVTAMLVELADRGVLAVAPDLMPDYRKKRYPGVGWASPWSHRHMAFAAGLGSFGMNDFFISEMGSAHRCGSIVVARRLEPDRERLPHHRHNCLQHMTGDCLECAKRCPVGATSEAGHDKDKCSRNVLANVPRNQLVNNVNIYGCGLCATGTPCSQESPVC
jgi:epoxyqueuosine reductase QueG